MNLTKLTLRNFLSVGNVTQAIRLDEHFLTLILGENCDTNGGVTRNGAGKTSILQAVCYAIYGIPMTGIKIDNLINDINKKAMLVTIEFEISGKTYRIERGRKPAVLKFFIDDEELKGDAENKAQGENRHTQEEIERIVGMSHTLFCYIVAINTFTDPFLKMKLGEQREVIEELLGATLISERADALRLMMSGVKERIRDLEAEYRAQTETNTRIEKTISQHVTDSASWNATHQRKIDQLLEEIDGLRSIDFDTEISMFDAVDAWDAQQKEHASAVSDAKREISLLTREIATLEGEIATFEREANTDVTAQLNRMKAEAERKKQTAARSEETIASLTSELGKLEQDISNPGEHTCVTCDQKLEGTNHLAKVLANLEQQAQRLRNKITTAETERQALLTDSLSILSEADVLESESVSKSKLAHEKLEAKLNLLDTPKTRLEQWKTKLDVSNAALAAVGSRPQTLFGTRDEAYKTRQMFDSLAQSLEHELDRTNPFQAKIDTLQATIIEVDTTELNEVRHFFVHQEFLLKLLTAKDSFVRKKIIDQNLSHLNARLDYYLDKLGLPHQVKFKSDLTVEITLLGRDYDFAQLSRGEMNRVNMATSWSFRDVWESLNHKFNLMFVDECLDQGTDAHGVEQALAILKQFAYGGKNVFLISHRDDVRAKIDRTMLVRKENGFTRFEESPS